ncbi:hypothetical protein EK904_009610 [Melospiza melodia maxima]|nr:hypothetical protein EK904_009610 [Melospiza melodia maxima]
MPLTEASQQKVEAAAFGRDVGNLNQQENVVEAPNCSHHFHANQLGYLYQLFQHLPEFSLNLSGSTAAFLGAMASREAQLKYEYLEKSGHFLAT